MLAKIAIRQNLLNSRSLFLMLAFLVINLSCINEEVGSYKIECDYGYQFDPITRSCIFAPNEGLQTITINEDSGTSVHELLFSNYYDGIASDCDILRLASGLDSSQTTCTCAGGKCYVTLYPDSNFNGITGVEYQLSGTGITTTITTRVEVNNVDDAPVNTTTTPVSGTASIIEDTSQTFTLGYSDVDGDLATSCSIASTEVYETASCSCDSSGVCSVTIQGNANENGSSKYFSYSVTTNSLSSENTIVYFDITSINDVPVIGDDQTIEVDEDTAISFNINAGSDPDSGDTLSYVVITSPTKGTLKNCMDQSGSTSGSDLSCTYTPDDNLTGSDSVVYKINDGSADSASNATVTLNITNIDNDPPVASPVGSFTIDEDTSVDFSINEAHDPEYETLIYSIVTAPSYGTLSVCTSGAVGDVISQGTTCTYTPNANYSGTDSFTYTVYDGVNYSILNDTIGFTITEINDPPTIDSIDSQQSNEGSYTILGNLAIDEGGDGIEDAETLTVEVTGSSNVDLIPLTNIELFRDSTSIGDGTTARAYNDGATSAGSYELQIKITPVVGLSGNSTIDIMVTDDGTVAATAAASFTFTVNPISAIHGGWKNITATGAKVDNYGHYQSSSCVYSTESCTIGESSGEDCTGEMAPSGDATPSSSNIVYYDDEDKTCYISTGTTDTSWSAFQPVLVTLVWNDFKIAGINDDTEVSISGWNIYRRLSGEQFDFDTPLNTSTISSSTRSYTDNTTESNQVYFYLVRPIDSIHDLPTATAEVFSEIRIFTPPPNMVFVHRWMVNKEVCGMMHMTTDSTEPYQTDPINNYRCPYAGPGETVEGTDTYYDIGRDMLVDMVEAGCNYTLSATAGGDCGSNGCIGIGDPDDLDDFEDAVTAGLVYYDRSSGKCYENDGTDDADDWIEIKSIAAFDATLANSINISMLPPLVNIHQTDAYDICDARSDLLAVDIPGIASDLSFKLPARKDQIAYTSWSSDYTATEIDTMEIGLSLNSGSKCNASEADGVIDGFSDLEMPSSVYLYTLPGTESSNIRSIYTGSVQLGANELTAECVSNYGVQDAIGNVMEWVTDQIVCGSTNLCVGVTDNNAGTLGVAKLDSSNDDMEVLDSIFDSYRFDGSTGPCNDSNADEYCDEDDDALDGWYFADETYSAGRFSFPLALPIQYNYIDEFPTSSLAVSNYVLSIGPTNGITHDELHNDYIYIGADAIKLETNGQASMATGGSYTSGMKAGRYAIDFFPYTEVAGTLATCTEFNAYDNLVFTADEAGVDGNNISITINSPADAIGVKASDTFTTLDDLTFTALHAGIYGNDISVEFVEDATPAGTESVSVSGNDITVHIDEAGATTTTSTVVSLVNGDAASSLLVVASYSGDGTTTPGESGTQYFLTGGVDNTEYLTLDGYNITISIAEGDTTAGGVAELVNNDSVASLLLDATYNVGDATPGIGGPFYLSGGIDDESPAQTDVGFRCIVPIPSASYDTDSYHSYSYD